jgi:hypothetical protein
METETKTKVEENGQATINPWQIQTLVDKRVWDYLPALFEGMKTIHEDLEEIKAILKEK